MERNDLINSATILREIYENILYIIAMSYDSTIKVRLNSQLGEYRKVLENQCENIFSDYIYPECFEYIYKYLCKIVHPCSLKELISHIESNVQNRKYVLNCIKYVMIMIEYIFLDFVNKRTDVDNNLNESIIDTCELINIFNMIRLIQNSKKDTRILKKYLLNDNNSRYLADKQMEVNEFAKYVKDNPDEFETMKNDILDRMKNEIENSKYREKVSELLK